MTSVITVLISLHTADEEYLTKATMKKNIHFGSQVEGTDHHDTNVAET